MSADIEMGNDALAAKSLISMFTFWSTWSCGSPAVLSDSRPLVIVTNLTVKSCIEPDEEAGGAAAGGFAWVFVPKLAKFHTPASDCTRAISGSWISMPVTFSFFEKIRGLSSTPTFNDLARMKGVLL